jgi:hypothetical protein
LPANPYAVATKSMREGLLQAYDDGIIAADSALYKGLFVGDLKKSNFIPTIILNNRKKTMEELTSQQVSEALDSITQPFIDAIVALLTAAPYGLTPEAAGKYAQEYVEAGNDSWVVEAVESETADGETTPEEAPEETAKKYKSKLAKSLVTKAGAQISAQNKAKLSACLDNIASAIKLNKDASAVI